MRIRNKRTAVAAALSLAHFRDRTTAAANAAPRRGETERVVTGRQFERALSGDSGDMSFDDDFWAYDDGSMDVLWDDYAVEPTTCLVYKNRHVIAFHLYGKGHNQCVKKQEGTYIMDAGRFARAYVAQKQIDYGLTGQGEYGAPEALDYLECTAVEYNDVYYYAKFGCSSQGGLKVVSYSDEDCSKEISTNIGLYNDIKIQFNVCQACVAWPVETDDAAGADAELDDNFAAYHAYDSKLCSAANEYREGCGWSCRKQVKKSLRSSSANGNRVRRGWGGFEKFFLFLWSFLAITLVWVVLKQRRMMTREDAIVEEAAMNGIGLKKRHVFPIAVGIVFVILFAMIMVWKRLTWLLLLGTNVGLFAHFVFLRRKAMKAGAGGDGYVKDAGLEIS